MKFLKNEKLLLNLIKFSPIILVLTLSLFTTSIFIKQQERHLEEEIKLSKEQFAETNKHRIEEEVNRIIDSIRLEQKNARQRIKKEIKTKVYNAHNIATNIYNALSKENHTKEEILLVIKSTLEKIRLNNDRGYYFLFDTKGTNLLHPLNKKFEGKNILNYPDATGYNFAEKMVSTIKNKSEDFTSYYWYKKTDDSKMYKKISFFKYFEPLNIGIGSGEYFNNYDEELQNKLLTRIQDLTYGRNGYIFVYNLDGICLSHFNKKLINVNRYNLKDSKGNYVVQDVLNFAKENKQGFMSYIAIMKPDSMIKNREKISYISFYENWGWVIGSGFYTDDFDKEIIKTQEKINSLNEKTIERILVISLVLTILFIVLSFIISKFLSNIFNDYRNSVKRELDRNLKSKEKLKFHLDLLEQSLSATDVIDEEGKFIFVNDAYVKMWGYNNKNEILGTSPIAHCDDPNMPKIIIETLEKEEEHTFQFKAKRKDGTTFDALMATKYITIKDEKFYVGSTIDISKQLELTNRYETLFANAREGVFLHELDGTLVDVNPYIEKLHNVSKETLIGVNISSFFKKEDINKAEVLVNELITKGEIKFEMELQRIDGSLFYASIKSQLIDFEGRQIVYGTLKDITVANENILLLERSQKVFQNIQEGVMITNADGYITEVNKAFSAITGYSYHDALGNKASILKSGKHNEKFYKKLWDKLQKEHKWSGKIVNKKKNGKTYTSFLTISSIIDNNGVIQNYIGIFADISEILKYEKELREKDIILIQQSKMASMGEMIDNIAHQWKQPLSIISMSNGLLKINQVDDKFSSDEEIEVAITNIDNGVKHLSSTIEDFRNFFNPDKNKKEFLVSNCINRVFKLLQSKFKNIDIKIIQNIDDSIIYGVENELVQVLMNIVSNSIDALYEIKEKEKYIFIDSHKKGNQVIISIKDNAGGISEEIIEKIFESRFTTKEEGTGIGLYMSKNIIESYKGYLNVENSKYLYNGKEFKGANFIIKI